MPIQLVQQVVFLEGGDAVDIFRMMYPEGKSYGSDKIMRSVIEHLKGFDDGRELPFEELNTNMTTGVFRTKTHIVVWNYPMRWIEFYRRTTKKAQGIKTK